MTIRGWRLFEGGYYSRAATIRGNTVYINHSQRILNKVYEEIIATYVFKVSFRKGVGGTFPPAR